MPDILAVVSKAVFELDALSSPSSAMDEEAKLKIRFEAKTRQFLAKFVAPRRRPDLQD